MDWALPKKIPTQTQQLLPAPCAQAGPQCSAARPTQTSVSSAEVGHCLNQQLVPPAAPGGLRGAVIKGSPFLSSLQVGMLKH